MTDDGLDDDGLDDDGLDDFGGDDFGGDAGNPDGPPIELTHGRYVIGFSTDERALLVSLLDELADLITQTTDENNAVLERLFPPASLGDDAANDEYQRLMRDDLLRSKQAAFDVTIDILQNKRQLDEADITALMQSVNSIRLMLGTILEVSDDPDEPEVLPGWEHSHEFHLYGYLSWLLEWCVHAITHGGRDDV